MPKVEQIDREAAWLFRAACYTEDDYSAWMAGTYDGNPSILAFAAHRLAERERLATVTPGMVEAGARALYERDRIGWQNKHPDDLFLQWDDLEFEAFKDQWRDEACAAYLAMLKGVR